MMNAEHVLIVPVWLFFSLKLQHYLSHNIQEPKVVSSELIMSRRGMCSNHNNAMQKNKCVGRNKKEVKER